MSDVSYKQIVIDGLWTNNAGLVQLLGLCPLLAVTNNAINGLGLGVATLLTLLISNASVSICRHGIKREIRIPFYVMVIATNVTVVDLLMNAYLPALHAVLGIFIPLIVTNCAIIARAETFASKQPLAASILDGLMMGLGFLLVLVVLGGMREIIGSGSLFSNASVMLGQWADALSLRVFHEGYSGFLLAVLPPGAFICLVFILAVKNIIDGYVGRKKVVRLRDARRVADAESQIIGGVAANE